MLIMLIICAIGWEHYVDWSPIVIFRSIDEKYYAYVYLTVAKKLIWHCIYQLKQ